MLEHSDRGIREHLEALMPPGGGARRLVGWGVVAWAGIGGVILLWAASRLLSPVAGVFPYLVMAAMVVFVLNPAVRRLTGLGLPRRSAATIVFVAALGLTVLMLSLLVPVLIHQGQHFITSSPRLIEKGGGLFQRLSRSSNPLLHGIGSAGSTWIRDHAGSAPRALQTATDAGLKLAQAGLILIVGG